ncbi:MAG TPA: hypothetical protein VFQ24_00050 [Terriglobia bacterium]|nr:hypothetical protein [Terriglobia bacterium]
MCRTPVARRTGKSRSQLFSDTLNGYLARHAPHEITEAMNRASVEVEETKNPFVSTAARPILRQSE